MEGGSVLVWNGQKQGMRRHRYYRTHAGYLSSDGIAPTPAVKRVATRPIPLAPSLPAPAPAPSPAPLLPDSEDLRAVGPKTCASMHMLTCKEQDAIEFREWAMNTPLVFYGPPPGLIPRRPSMRVDLVREIPCKEDAADLPCLAAQDALARRMALTVIEDE